MIESLLDWISEHGRFVDSAGKNENLNWVKYTDGTVDIYGTADYNAGTGDALAGTNNTVYYKALTIGMPISLTAVDSINLSLQGSVGSISVASVSTSIIGAIVTRFGNANIGTGTVHIVVSGKWNSPLQGGRKGAYMIDSLFKFIADKFKETSDKYLRQDVTSQIPIDGLTTIETNYEVTKTGDRVDMTGFLRLGGQLATGIYVNAFTVPQDLRADKYTAFSVYAPKSCGIAIQTDGKGYVINNGTQALSVGDTVVFSGSWTIGGGQHLKSLLHSFLGRRWRHVCEC